MERPRQEQQNVVHRAAVALALGLRPPFDLVFELDLPAEIEVSDFLTRLSTDEAPRGAAETIAAIEAFVRRVEPAFSLSDDGPQREALSLLEDECLVLISGIGGPARLRRALVVADRLFGGPSWIGSRLRAYLGAALPSDAETRIVIEELPHLLERIQSRIDEFLG